MKLQHQSPAHRALLRQFLQHYYVSSALASAKQFALTGLRWLADATRDNWHNVNTRPDSLIHAAKPRQSPYCACCFGSAGATTNHCCNQVYGVGANVAGNSCQRYQRGICPKSNSICSKLEIPRGPPKFIRTAFNNSDKFHYYSGSIDFALMHRTCDSPVIPKSHAILCSFNMRCSIGIR